MPFLPKYGGGTIGNLVRFSARAVDFTSATDVSLGASENNNQIFIPLYAVIFCNDFSGSGTLPSVSFGTNASTYDNIMTAQPVGNGSAITGINMNVAFWFGGPIDKTLAITCIQNNTELFMKISVNAGHTTFKGDVHLFGYYHSYYAP